MAAKTMLTKGPTREHAKRVECIRSGNTWRPTRPTTPNAMDRTHRIQAGVMVWLGRRGAPSVSLYLLDREDDIET